MVGRSKWLAAVGVGSMAVGALLASAVGAKDARAFELASKDAGAFELAAKDAGKFELAAKDGGKFEELSAKDAGFSFAY